MTISLRSLFFERIHREDYIEARSQVVSVRSRTGNTRPNQRGSTFRRSDWVHSSCRTPVGSFQIFSARGSSRFKKVKHNISLPVLQVGTRVKCFACRWLQWSKGPWVLEAVTYGFRLPLLETPIQAHLPVVLDDIGNEEMQFRTNNIFKKRIKESTVY